MNNSKILVVDDERDLREALKTSLEEAGYEVLTANDGGEGLRAALANKPDLIVLDIQMPHMNGHQMLHELRKDVWGMKVPVLMLTNADDATNITQGVEQRSNDYIIKTQISLAEVAKKVKQYLAGYHHS
jgi:two-component system alkaline phosphatase synthesis response regulator PhoP